MWGNKQGWLISACIVLVMSWLLWQVGQVPPMSQPSGRFPKLLDPVVLPVDPSTLVTMNDPCDAGEPYRQAIAEYQRNPKLYDTFTNKKFNLADLKALEPIVKAAKCSKMTLFLAKPEELVRYRGDSTALAALDVLGRVTREVGASYLTSNPEEARKYFEADFALGAKLADERLSWEQFNQGVNHMADSATGLKFLAKKAKDDAKADAATRFTDQVLPYKGEKVFKVIGVTRSIDGKAIGTHGGDLFALAARSPDRMLRTEAILAIGRMRFNTPRLGDQKAAPRELQKWLNDPDPAVRAAANMAHNLTEEEYRTLGS